MTRAQARETTVHEFLKGKPLLKNWKSFVKQWNRLNLGEFQLECQRFQFVKIDEQGCTLEFILPNASLGGAGQLMIHVITKLCNIQNEFLETISTLYKKRGFDLRFISLFIKNASEGDILVLDEETINSINI